MQTGSPRTSPVIFVLASLCALSPGCSTRDNPAETMEPSTTSGDSDGTSETTEPTEGGPHLSCLEDGDVVTGLPSGSEAYAAEGFTQYAEVVAPNGKAIRIYAQAAVDPLAIYRARNLLRFFLSDVPDSKYGADKEAVANAMADNQAVLMMPAGAHEEGNEPNLPAQPLYEEETPIDGSAWYIDNNFEHRDAALEEIFHLVHDTGIGTDFPGALPSYQSELLAEAKAAIDDGRWGIAAEPGVSDWLDELAAENSLAQEYIVSVIDSYYGLWGPWKESSGGMWGVYIAKTRDEVFEKDPNGAALLEAFLPPMLDYEARLASSFAGTFSMAFDPEQPYTHKSRYLVQVTLTGVANANLIGNDADNTLRGNVGDNSIDGGAGEDRVVYCSPRDDYELTLDPASGTLTISGPEGTDSLSNIEKLHFADGIVEVSSLMGR